jgi:hypothetical protein
VTDPKKKRSPAQEYAEEREMQRAVEEGIDVVSLAMKQLLERPKAEREEHLKLLLQKVRSLSEQVELTSGKGEAHERIKAVERVIEILQKLAEK